MEYKYVRMKEKADSRGRALEEVQEELRVLRASVHEVWQPHHFGDMVALITLRKNRTRTASADNDTEEPHSDEVSVRNFGDEIEDDGDLDDTKDPQSGYDGESDAYDQAVSEGYNLCRKTGSESVCLFLIAYVEPR